MLILPASPALRKPSTRIVGGWAYTLQKPIDRELRIETTGLRQSKFRLGVVPLRGLAPANKA